MPDPGTSHAYTRLGRFALIVTTLLWGSSFTIMKDALATVPALWLLAIPFVILEVMLLGLGVGIIVSSLTTKYRDLAIAVGFGVQLWMYASPVVYPLSMLDNSPRLRVLVQLNPMTSPIEIFRMATLGTGTVTMFGIVYSLIFTAAALVLGVVLFSRIEKTFMDTV